VVLQFDCLGLTRDWSVRLSQEKLLETNLELRFKGVLRHLLQALLLLQKE